MRKKQPKPVPQTRFELAAQIKNNRPEVSRVLSSIEVLKGNVMRKVDRAVGQALTTPTTSVIGSDVQVPQADPGHERAIDFLNFVEAHLMEIQREEF